ncbi:hypothetical protein AVEN_144710-1 [Araneus ventricosus]|uniref:Uncharacterized protein n=1 Tax=Araneus ventricosus TaxID=182803 RepID=A0A4Y2RTV7_ARAVE|nr:hypothetical protein AVEN_144710-1 [Araneus ventricosus]
MCCVMRFFNSAKFTIGPPPLEVVRFRSGCWEMATDNSVISKMQIQQLLHWCSNVRRGVILHTNCAIHTSMLLQCLNEIVTQKIFVTCPIDCTGYSTRRTNLLKKERANDKCCRKPTPLSDLLRMKRQWLHLERILSCPYSAILSFDRTLEMEMGFVCPQNVPWPWIVHFHSNKKLQGESFSFWQVSRNQLLNMSNFEWIALQDVS